MWLSLLKYIILVYNTRSLGALWAPTSRWRPFGPAWLRPSRPSGAQAVWPTQKSEKPLKIRSFWHQRISGSSFRSRDMARNPKKIQKSRNTEIQKSKNSICFWKSEKPSKIRSIWHQRFSGSSFRSREIAVRIFCDEEDRVGSFWAQNMGAKNWLWSTSGSPPCNTVDTERCISSVLAWF